MYNYLVTMVLFFVPAGTAMCQDEESELTRLEGSWSVASIIEDGELVPDEVLRGYTFVFKKRTLTWFAPNGETEDRFEIAINPSKRPKEIDLIQTADENEEKKMTCGIFEIKDDVLRICIPPRGSSARPTALESKSDALHSLITLKRIKK